jgi:hypothetical protein
MSPEAGIRPISRCGPNIVDCYPGFDGTVQEVYGNDDPCFTFASLKKPPQALKGSAHNFHMVPYRSQSRGPVQNTRLHDLSDPGDLFLGYHRDPVVEADQTRYSNDLDNPRRRPSAVSAKHVSRKQNILSFAMLSLGYGGPRAFVARQEVHVITNPQRPAHSSLRP